MSRTIPTVVYRFFQKEWQATAFLSGNVWISTIKKCREYEDSERGDKEEAHEIIKSGYLQGDSNDLNFVKNSKTMGVEIGHGCTN